MTMLNETDLTRRATAAYYRKGSGQDGQVMQPSPAMLREHKGLHYVVLKNVRGVLAVYRVRIVNGEAVLKGLKRWPSELEG